MRLAETPLIEPLAHVLARPPGQNLMLYWLGQAGFVVDGGGKRSVIDPYLSDSLAEKYRSKPMQHLRMMPAPVRANEIRHVDLVLATHAHTDHLDPGTLPLLLNTNPAAQLVVPRAARAVALERSRLDPARLVVIEAGETLEPGGIRITATRAAHETIERDDQGNHRFLGFALGLAGRTVFHSGDTIPFDGQITEAKALNADLALFPVNGRDVTRAANGIPGNMTMKEAQSLARNAGISTMIAHHFDMFDFNTIPRQSAEEFARGSTNPCIFAARTGVVYEDIPASSKVT